MDKQKYLNILNTDINRFISYLIDDNLDGLDDADKVNLYITDSFPYLSILHLIHSNYDSKEVDNFVKRYESILVDETKQLRFLLGYFLCDNTELEALKLRLVLSQKENEEKTTEIKLLNEDLINAKEQEQSLEKDIKILKEENEKLINKIVELELKISKSVSIPISEPSFIDSDSNNTTGVLPPDLVDMGTSVLWRSSNLGAEKEFEEGDCFSWGALSSAEYFGSDVWGYKQVVKKNISGSQEFDAAQSILGEGYRIPTVKEWEELMRICDFKPRTISIKGRKYVKLVSSITNKQLLLPIIGHIESDVCQNNYAQYWAAEQSTGKSAHICQIHEANWDLTYAPKWRGLPIRPVYDPLVKTNTKESSTTHQTSQSESIVSQNIQELVTGICEQLGNVRTTIIKNNKRYPAKKDINESNIYNLLIKDCLPYGKNVFAGDIVRNIKLDLAKLNNILMVNYFVGPIAKFTIEKMTFSRFKEYLCYLLSK